MKYIKINNDWNLFCFRYDTCEHPVGRKEGQMFEGNWVTPYIRAKMERVHCNVIVVMFIMALVVVIFTLALVLSYFYLMFSVISEIMPRC